jgi:hypothetical protein
LRRAKDQLLLRNLDLDVLERGAHARPHFHARNAGQAASIDFAGELIAGTMPRRALTLVREWAKLHEEELEANWERARRDEPLLAIEPLP